MNETVIKVDHVRKTYRSYKSNFQKMKHMLILSGAGEKNRVLKDVSFEVHKGEKVAILSHAGGGKSTILRILAGIIKPEAGTVEVKEEPTLLLDYRMGFDLGLNGRDNYRIRAKIMGWPDDLIKAREKDVFKFAGLSHEKDTTLKNYPRGAASRLGFSISTMDKADLLLMDERISFGNTKINEKCVERFAEIITPEMTLVMAGNDFPNNSRFCERGIVIHDGMVAFDGTFEEALDYHKSHATKKTARKDIKSSSDSFDVDDSDDAFE